MNWTRGLLRVWAVLAVCWVAPLTWIKWNDLSGNAIYDPWAGVRVEPKNQLPYLPPGATVGNPSSQPSNFDPIKFELFKAEQARREKQIAAAQLILFPPALLILLGLAVGWVINGFKPKT